MWCDWCEAKSKLASLDPFFGVPGPFTAELTKFSSTLISYYFISFFIMGGQMLTGFPCIQGNVKLFLTRQHQIDGLHILRHRGAVSFVLMLSPARLHSAFLLMKYRAMKDDLFCMFVSWSIFWGSLASLSINEFTTLGTNQLAHTTIWIAPVALFPLTCPVIFFVI